MKQCRLSEIIVKAPATSANIGPGFDVFGLALEKLIYNVGQAAAMASGFATGDVELIGKSLTP